MARTSGRLWVSRDARKLRGELGGRTRPHELTGQVAGRSTYVCAWPRGGRNSHACISAVRSTTVSPPDLASGVVASGLIESQGHGCTNLDTLPEFGEPVSDGRTGNSTEEAEYQHQIDSQVGW